MAMGERVTTVLGATGYTGRLVAGELHRRGIRFALAGRDARRLEQLSRQLGGAETLIADAHHPASLARLAAGSSVIVNCAGPFADLGERVILAAMEHGAHYVDTSAEQAFAKAVQAHDGTAREKGVAVVPGMAFEIALADCAAALAADGFRDVRTIQIVYATAFHPSRGTLRTALRTLAGPSWAYAARKWVEEPPGRRWIEVKFPAPVGRVAAVSFPGAEVIAIPAHLDVLEVRTYLSVPRLLALAVGSVSPLVPPLARLLGPLAMRLLGEARSGPDEETRARDRFYILVEARGVRAGRARSRRVLVSGTDPYGLTAAVAATAAQAVAAAGFAGCGVLAPAQLVEPRKFLDGLRERGVRYQVHDG